MPLKIGKISNKIASVDNIGDKLGAFNRTTRDQAVISQDPRHEIATAKSENQIGIENFPSDIGNKYFYLKFSEYAYSSAIDRVNYSNNNQQDLKEYIVLPIPREIQEKYGVNYSNSRGGLTLAATEDIVYGSRRPDTDPSLVDRGEYVGANAARLATFGASTAAIQSTIKGKFVRAGVAVTGAFLSGGATETAELTFGVTNNPVERALLENVPLRDHQFSWKLSPRNKKELESINRIISIIRAKMHPENIVGEFAFRFPDVVDFGFRGTLKNVPFKPGFITNFSINHTPDGTSFFMNDGEPTAYMLNLNIKEFEPIRKTDFNA